MRNHKPQAASYKRTAKRAQSAESVWCGEDEWSESSDGAPAFLKDEAPQQPVAGFPNDLEERTTRFGEAVVRFLKRVPRGPVNDRLIGQLAGCGTSIGANYAEATEALSQRDYRLSVSRCLKETKETRHFLRMIAASEPSLAEEARVLYREASQFRLIFGSMYRKRNPDEQRPAR